MLAKVKMKENIEETSKKRQRPDRSKKLQARKESKETVIKSCLKKYLQVENKELVLKAIDDRVVIYSKRMKHASILLLGFIKALFHNVEDVRTVVFPPQFFEATTIRNFILGIEKSRKDVDNRIVRYLCENDNMIISTPRHLGDRNIYSSGARDYLTNLKNHCFMNLENCVKKFCEDFRKVNRLSIPEKVYMIFSILGWDHSYRKDNIVPRLCMVEMIDYIRSIFDLQANQSIDDKWLKTYFDKAIKFFVYHNRYKDLHELKKHYNIIPFCGTRRKFLTIDSSVLYGIMKETKLINCNSEIFDSLKMDHWASFINFKMLQGKTNTFTGTIQTDGILVCSHFTRPKKLSDSKIIFDDKFFENKRVIGCDPGRANIAYMVEKMDDGKMKEYVFTQKQYYQETGINKINKQIKRWNREIKDIHIALSTASVKGVKFEDHQRYVETYLTHKDRHWTEMLKARWSRTSISLYSGKKRAIAKFCNRIKNVDKTKDIVIIYGSAKFAPGGKGEVSVPTNNFYKEISSRFVVKLTSEYRTTVTYSKDENILDKVVDKKNKKWSVRGLLWCNSPVNNELGIYRPHFVNRDRNAALNILRCAIDTNRPLSLTRTPDKEKVHQEIGKAIKVIKN